MYEVSTIKHRLTCDSCNIMCLLYCGTCNHLQYVGETKHSLRTMYSDTQIFQLSNHTFANKKRLAIEKLYAKDTRGWGGGGGGGGDARRGQLVGTGRSELCFSLGLICNSSPIEVCSPLDLQLSLSSSPLTHPLLLWSLGLIISA